MSEQNQINAFGKIQDGRLKIENRDLIEEWAKRQHEGDNIVIRFTNSKDFRTLRQLRLLYKCLREISNITGHTIEEVKLLMKEEAGLFVEETINSKQYTIIKSVGDMSSKELSNFIEFIDRWCTTTLNVTLLNYDDLNFLKT